MPRRAANANCVTLHQVHHEASLTIWQQRGGDGEGGSASVSGGVARASSSKGARHEGRAARESRRSLAPCWRRGRRHTAAYACFWPHVGQDTSVVRRAAPHRARAWQPRRVGAHSIRHRARGGESRCCRIARRGARRRQSVHQAVLLTGVPRALQRMVVTRSAHSPGRVRVLPPSHTARAPRLPTQADSAASPAAVRGLR